MAEQPVYLDVEIFDPWDDDEGPCAVCGDALAAGDQVVWEPEPSMGERAHVLAHAGCSIRNGYRLRWPEPAIPVDSTLIELRVYEDEDAGWTEFTDDLEYIDRGFVVQCPRHLWTDRQAAETAMIATHEALCTTLRIHPREGVTLEPCPQPDCEEFTLPAHSFKGRLGDAINIPERVRHGHCRTCGHSLEAHTPTQEGPDHG